MDSGTIFQKTAKGEEAIRDRAHDLDRNLRYVLILVDGKSTVQQLVEEKGAAMEDVAGRLQRLAEGGFITSGEAAESTGGGGDAAAVKVELIATAREVLGPDAGKVVAKLEAAPDSKAGIMEVVSGCKKLVKLVIDEKKAEELMRRCSAVLDKL